MPLTPVTAFLLKAVFILVFMIINLRGLEEVSIASTIFCIIILIAFAAVTVVGLIHWENDPFTPFMVCLLYTSTGASVSGCHRRGAWYLCAG